LKIFLNRVIPIRLGSNVILTFKFVIELGTWFLGRLLTPLDHHHHHHPDHQTQIYNLDFANFGSPCWCYGPLAIVITWIWSPLWRIISPGRKRVIAAHVSR